MSEATSVPISLSVPEAVRKPGLKGTALVTILTVLTILGIYYETTWSLVSIWERSDTFAHCFLIAPISAWLVWRQRKELKTMVSRPNLWALIGLVCLGFGWLLATLANVLVFQQYFLVAMIPVAVWAILGNGMAAAIAFPLAYLLFAVPFGEVFIPTLINFTADFTVAALKLTGIPVYREGAFFSLASGNWSVVEACSGLRYLIASFTLGTLYAYLTYHSLKRRLVFSAISLLVPIVANGVRAYMIVMIGHLSGMTLAVGVDHLVYGWLFFGLVMLLLFWIGSIWREDTQTSQPKVTYPVNTRHSKKSQQPATLKASAGVATAVVAIALLWPAYVIQLERAPGIARPTTLAIPDGSQKWEVSSSELTHWRPVYVGEPVRFLRTYRGTSGSVSVYIAGYRNQRPGSQLITSGNVLAPENDPEWRNVGEQIRNIDLGSQSLTVRQNQLHSHQKRLLLWRWYSISAQKTTSPQMAKMILARNKLFGRGDEGAEIIVVAQYEYVPEEAVPVLRDFLNDMLPEIRKGLVDAAAN